MTSDSTPHPAPFRAASVEDLTALTALERVAFPDPWPVAALGTALADPQTLVLVAPGVPLRAYAAFRVLPGDGELLRLAVSPTERGRGLGRRLLDHGLESMVRAGATPVFLEVRADNRAALALYRSAGFRPVGERKGYYRDGETALLLRWDPDLDRDPAPEATPA